MADSPKQERSWYDIPGKIGDWIGKQVDNITKWATKKAGDVVEGAARERLGPVADMLLPAQPAPGGGTPAPDTGRAASPAPASAAAAGSPAPATAPQGEKSWFSGIVDGFKKMFNIGVDTSTGEKKDGLDFGKIINGAGKLIKDYGPYGMAMAVGVGAAMMASSGGAGWLGAFIIGALAYGIAMAAATPLMKWAGNKISGLAGGKSPEVESAAPSQQVSIGGPGVKIEKEEGVVASVVSGAKRAWDATTEVATNTWQSVANTARSLVGSVEKPYSRVLAWTDKLNLPALETSNGLKTGLLSAVMHAESAGKNTAVSDKEAGGLFQFIPGTGARYGMPKPDDRFIPEKSSKGAADYLKDLGKMFGNHTPSMLAGYNWGEGNVQKLNKQGYKITDDGFAEKDGKKFDILPKETKGYIQKIMGVLPAYAEASTAITMAKASSGTVVADAGGTARSVASGGATPDETAKKAAEELIRRAKSGQISSAGDGVSVLSSGAPLSSPTTVIPTTEKPRVVITTG